MNNYYVMLHDEMRCIGCQSCTVACANLNDVSREFAKVQVRIEGPVNGRYQFVRISCQHCAEAPCLQVCPTGATYKDKNEIVRVNASKCVGCNFCVASCPYKVRYVDKAKKTSDKCDFCAESRLINGETPACVSVCPTDALHFGQPDSLEVQEWFDTRSHIYQDQKPGTGELRLFRNKEVHQGVKK